MYYLCVARFWILVYSRAMVYFEGGVHLFAVPVQVSSQGFRKVIESQLK
ncbi:MAG: hypothetical protein ACOC36_06435 [Fibrobacterota bacterium]